MFHGAELAPRHVLLFQRVRHRAPVYRCHRRGGGCTFLGGEKPHCTFGKRSHNFFPRGEIFVTLRLEFVQMHGDRHIRRFERAVKGVPHTLLRWRAGFVELLPAFTQLVDGICMRFERHFFLGGVGQCLCFGGDFFTPLRAAPALPIGQAFLLVL